MTMPDWDDANAVRVYLEPLKPIMVLDVGVRTPKYGPEGDIPETELHVPTHVYPVPVYIEPELSHMGRQYWFHGYSTSEPAIVLKEWNSQVLMHEILHIALAGIIPQKVPDYWQITPHNVINAVEVALTPWLSMPDLPQNEGG